MENSKQGAEDQRPKAVLWLESSITKLHIQHMAMLSKSLGEKGFDVSVLTSEDTVQQFKKAGGKLDGDRCAEGSKIDFGEHATFLTPLVSQKTYSKPDISKIAKYRYLPFEFMASPTIRSNREAAISKVMDEVKPDAIVTSLWPGGYGPFTPEVDNMVARAKKYKFDVKVYSLSNDIPYLDYNLNNPGLKAKQFDNVDRTFVRGDGTIKLDANIPLSRYAHDRLHYVGHFVNKLPPRTEMADKERKVLFTYGTQESDFSGDNYLKYFKATMSAASYSYKLNKHPWEVIVGPKCPDRDYAMIKEYAENLNEHEDMRITVRRGVSDALYKQQVADAALRICQYDTFILDDMSTGVPAFVTTGNISEVTCGALEGSTRVNNILHNGAPVSILDQYYLYDVNDITTRLNKLYEKGQCKSFSLPLDAPNKAAAIIAHDIAELHTREAPDPVLDTARASQQVPIGRSVS